MAPVQQTLNSSSTLVPTKAEPSAKVGESVCRGTRLKCAPFSWLMWIQAENKGHKKLQNKVKTIAKL